MEKISQGKVMETALNILYLYG
uniref:Uncharacterized protein n=1 Tax=Rhizophora mucronata TaxID=61149 RepID=A0A2P2Q378_RHIMU